MATPLASTRVPEPSKAVMRLVHRAVRDFELIQPGDKVAVGVSGGKDSLLLCAVMDQLARRRDLDFTWTAVHLDQKQPGFDRATFEATLETLGVQCHVVTQDTWSVVKEKTGPKDIPCALCSRMRRGILNEWCVREGYTKLAMGHHLDDAVETFFLNLLFGHRLQPLLPRTPSEKTGITTIRPLVLVEEEKVRDWVTEHGLGVVDCPVCDRWPQSSRRDLKTFMTGLEAMGRDVRASVRTALYEHDAGVALARRFVGLDGQPSEL